MATISGMDYERVFELCDELTTKKNSISDVLTNELMGARISEIAQNYEGVAADTTQKRINEQAKKVLEAIEKIITDLHNEAQQQQANYQAQDNKVGQ